MLMIKSRNCTALILALLVFTITFVSHVSGQRRDYMTDAEADLVRDAQDLDKRIDVLTKMIDRRFVVLGIDVGGWKPNAKQAEKWGAEPAGTRLQLLNDIRLLLQKGIDDVDDVAMHNDNALAQNRKEGQIFPRAVRLFASAAQRYRDVLKATAGKTRDEKELGTMLSGIESCEQVIEAVGKLPPETAKTKKN